jgi:hypothetical protein
MFVVGREGGVKDIDMVIVTAAGGAGQDCEAE